MGLFGFGKKDKVVDLSEKYRRERIKAAEIKADMEESSSIPNESPLAAGFGFLGNLANSTSTSNSSTMDSESINDLNSSGDERKRRLAKRLMDITSKLEDLSNQIYHLQQRVEVLERKSNVGTGSY